MLAIMSENVVNVGFVTCSEDNHEVCDHFGITESKVCLFPNIKENKHNYYEISGADQSVEAKHIFKAVLSKLPNVRKLSHKDIKSIWDELTSDQLANPWIIEFTSSDKDVESNQLEAKRLISLMSGQNVNLGKVLCDKEPKACSQFYIQKKPSFGVLKAGPTYELYHG